MMVTRVIYADTLLFVNFSMDFLSLYITVKLIRGIIRPVRMTLAAGIGALWALFSALLELHSANIFGQIIMLVAHLICAAVISAVATGERSPRIMPTVTFLAVNVGLGGIMTALYSTVGAAVGSELLQGASGDTASTVVFVISAAVAGAVSILYGKLRERYLSRKTVGMTLGVLGSTACFEALCDSGNLLLEPFSGKPVVVLSAKRMEGRLPQRLISAAYEPYGILSLQGLGVRLVTMKTVTGSGMMLCFTPEYICVEGRQIDAVVALDTGSDDYGGCDAIIGHTLLNV